MRGDADLLILDEPSSGLDPEAEHEVHRTLGRHRLGRTALLVSAPGSARCARPTRSPCWWTAGSRTRLHDELMALGGGRYAAAACRGGWPAPPLRASPQEAAT